MCVFILSSQVLISDMLKFSMRLTPEEQVKKVLSPAAGYLVWQGYVVINDGETGRNVPEPVKQKVTSK